ncbi:MAG: hypothetical protein ACYC96_11985 [Fimbriimonadaceae bacterium]
METTDAFVCTWCRRALQAPRRFDPFVANTPSGRTNSALKGVTVGSFVALFAIIVTLVVLLQNKDQVVAQNSDHSAAPPIRGLPDSTESQGGVAQIPTGSAPIVGQRPSTRALPAQSQPAERGGQQNGYVLGAALPAAMAPEPDDGFTHVANPAVSYRFKGFHRDSPGVTFRTEFHCAVRVRNDGGASIDYVALPPLDLVFSDGTSYRAEPVVVNRKGGKADAKEAWSVARSGDANLAPHGQADIEYVATSNSAPAALSLIQVQLRARGGVNLDLPITG